MIYRSNDCSLRTTFPGEHRLLGLYRFTSHSEAKANRRLGWAGGSFNGGGPGKGKPQKIEAIQFDWRHREETSFRVGQFLTRYMELLKFSAWPFKMAELQQATHQGNPPDLIQPPKHQNPPHLDPPCRHHYLEPYCHLCWRPLGPMAVSMGSYNWLKPYPPGPAGSGKRFIQWMRITRWLSMCFYQLILVHGCPNVSDTCLSCSPPVEGVEDVRIHLTIFFLDGLKPPSK